MSVDKNEVFQRVTMVLSSILLAKSQRYKEKFPKMDWDTDVYDDLGLDSLELLDLLTGLEEEFQVNPDQYEANHKRKISEIVDYTIQLIKEKADGIKK